MSLKLLSIGWSSIIHIQSSYIPTYVGGGHQHLQGRRYNRPKNTCNRKCLSCHTHIAIIRVALLNTETDGLPPTWVVGHQGLCVEEVTQNIAMRV